MNNSGYVILSRQASLLRELNSVSNNIANADTTGFKKENQFFSEYIRLLDPQSRSLSQTNIGGRFFDAQQGALTETGATFDLAIEGEGYFKVQTPAGERLTRAGSFSLNTQGELTNPEGYAVLSDGGSPIAIPAGAKTITVAPDGSIAVDGAPLGKVGIVTAQETSLMREGGNLFKTDGEVVEVENPRIAQGFIEESNVNPVVEIARLIEVQRAYEMSQKLLQDEDERIFQNHRLRGAQPRIIAVKGGDNAGA